MGYDGGWATGLPILLTTAAAGPAESPARSSHWSRQALRLADQVIVQVSRIHDRLLGR
jgi:hypothetical protein